MLDEIQALLKEIGTVKGAYLASCSLINNQWRVDFYSKKEHKIVTYFKENGKLQSLKDEIFQKEQKHLEELELKKVKVHYLQALEKISAQADKFIVILQTINHIPVWNITALTIELNVYNIKVNAENGDVISEDQENIMNFKKGGPSFKMGDASS